MRRNGQWRDEPEYRKRKQEVMWQVAMEKKPSLAFYRSHKMIILAERLYDNSVKGSLLFEAFA